MAASEIERITDFKNRFAKAQATDVIDLSWGFAVLQQDFPHSHVHNRIIVTEPVPAADILETAERVLGGADLRHRFVSFGNDELAQVLVAEFEAAGYEHEPDAAMVYRGPKVASSTHQVKALRLDQLRSAIMRDWRLELPNATEETLGQLADRKALYTLASEVTLLAVYDGDEIGAHADLFTDRVGHLAQFENLVTHPAFRGRGYAGALVREALIRGQQAGCELFFLTADTDDWPYEWYQRLGYVEVGRTHHFSRPF